jgi:hypothetical protein
VEYFAAEGNWWLPADPSRTVPGTLTFDEDGVNLVLYDSLRPFAPSGTGIYSGGPESIVEPLVLGRTRDRRNITLFDVSGLSMSGPFAEVTEEFFVGLALVGIHTTADSIRRAWCRFDYLEAWSQPEPIYQFHKDDDHLHLRWATPEEMAYVELPDITIRLRADSTGTAGESVVHVERSTSFQIDPAVPQTTAALLDTSVRPLQDLLAFALGRPIRLTGLQLVPFDIPDGGGSGEAFFNAVQPRPNRGREPNWGDVIGYTAPTIVTPKDFGLDAGELVRRWFGLRSRHARTVSLLLTPLYAPFMYTDQVFGLTYQAAESLRSTLPGTDMSRQKHAARCKAIVDAAVGSVDEDTLEWAERVLLSRNDKPMHEVITQVVKSAGSVGEKVLTAAPDFGRTVTRARAGVAHPKAGDLDSVGLYWHAQVLRWVVRTCLLMELVGEGAAEKVAEREPFNNAVRHVAALPSQQES